MFLDYKSKGKPYKENQEIITEYQILFADVIESLLAPEEWNRVTDISEEDCDNPYLDEMRQEAEGIIAWLCEREQATIHQTSAPGLLSVMEQCHLNREERMAFMVLIMSELSFTCNEQYKMILKRRNERVLTIGLVYEMLTQVISISTDQVLWLFRENGSLMRYCIERLEHVGAINFNTEIYIRNNVVGYCRGWKEEEIAKHQPYYYLKADTSVYAFDDYIEIVERLLEHAGSEMRMVHISGADYSGKKSLLNQVGKRQKKAVLHIDASRLTYMSSKDARFYLREIVSEVRIQEPLVYLDCSGIGENRKIFSDCVEMLKEEVTVLFVSLPQECKDAFHVDTITIDMEKENIGRSKRIWEGMQKEYSTSPEVVPEQLASKYNLSSGNIRRVFEKAEWNRILSGADTIQKSHIEQAVYETGSIDFAGLATRIPAMFGWEDIELEEEARNTLNLVCGRINARYQVGEVLGLNQKLAYGKGVSVLFYGAPGTGKTMCAQVLAREIGMELYRVDLSRLVSKYIGETEKNLGRVFDEAKKGNMLLFFDEADSLFAKRTEVTDSKDKYANAETSYLLQKMEEYPGITILATNFMQNFDVAVLRRITYSVKFEQPDVDTRYRLWTTILPDTVIFDGAIDLYFIAEKFELCGSNIKSILYNAAYMAIMDVVVPATTLIIQAKHLVKAIWMEYTKLGRFLQRADFESYGIYLDMDREG